MKFLASEHSSIKALIESNELNMEDFAFVKRHGKLYIRYKESDSEFVLHRKTETVLDTNNNWDKKDTYQLFEPVQLNGIRDWKVVLKELEKWLKPYYSFIKKQASLLMPAQNLINSIYFLLAVPVGKDAALLFIP